MTIDCIDSADDTTAVSDSMDGFGCSPATSSWNGRDVALATEKHYRLALIAQFYAVALQQINNMAQVETDATRYELLDLQNELIEEISQNFDSYAEAAHLFSGRAFTLADLDQHQTEIAYCKSFWKKLGDGFTDLGKGTAKLAKKTGKGAKKGAKKTVDFVKDHKTECLIGLAVVAAACGLVAVAGACGGAAAAANGVDATHKKREDEEDPHSNDHPSPPPVAVPPPVNNPPPDPNAVTHFLEGLRTGKIEPVSQPTFDLSHKSDTPATPEPLAPPPVDNPLPNPNALSNFIEGLRTGKIEPVEKPVFDLSHKSESAAVATTPVAPPPVDNLPINPNALSNFIEGLRTGKIEPVEKPVFDLSHKSESAAVATTPVAPPPVANSAPAISAPFQNVIASFVATLSHGLETIGRGMSESELFDPNSPLEPLIRYDINRQKAAAASGSIDIPSSDTSFSLKESITSFSEKITETLQRGLEILGRNTIDPQLFDPNSPLNHFNQEAKEKQKADMATLFGDLNPLVNPLPIVLAPLKSAYAFFVECLNSAPEDLANSVTIANNALSTLFKPEKSRYFNTDGISPNGQCVTFINGMNNTFAEATGSAEHIRGLGLNPRIDGIYNHSNNPLNDAAESVLFNCLGYSPITQGLLIQKWTEFYEKNKDNPRAKCLHFCHSQGAFHTKNALMRLPKEIRDRIIVVALAPATIVPKEFCFDSFNYASEKDFIHLFENFVTHASALFESDDHSNYFERLRILKGNKDQLILLKPHEDAKWPDHEIKTKTFEDIIKYTLKDYADHNGEY